MTGQTRISVHRHTMLAAATAGLFALAAGCPADPLDDDDVWGDDDAWTDDDDDATPDEDVPACVDDGMPRQITADTEHVDALVAGINQFALELHAANRGDDGNLFFSPFSVAVALSMLAGGAEGDTEAQLLAALGVEIAEEDWHDIVGRYLQDLSGDQQRCYSLYSASAAWGQHDLPFEAPYLDLLEQAYAAPLQTADFEHDADGAADAINTWIADQTAGHIPSLLAPGDLHQDTLFALFNALYFEASWEEQFDPDRTEQRSFFVTPEHAVPAQLMRMETTLQAAWTYYESETNYIEPVELVELPYTGGDVSMVVLLPGELDGLPALEDALTPALLDQLLGALDSSWVDLTLPRMELDLELPLTENLATLGVVDPFDPELADLGGIVSPVHLDANLHVDAVRHRAFVRVDELGTEAAAATGVETGDDCAANYQIRADHPFLFLIRDRLTGAILFLGRLNDPTG